jgi:plastocyanin
MALGTIGRPMAVVVLVWAAFIAAGSAQPAGRTWKVAIGGETPDHGIQAQIFAPTLITINAGDTVTWTMAAGFDHTVSFLSGARQPPPVVPEPGGKFLFNPLITTPQGGPTYNGKGIASSGFLHLTGSYSLTFTKPGRYAYLCLLHRGMAGTVAVLAPGKKLPATQADLDRKGALQVKSALARGGSLLKATKASVVKSAKGTTYVSPLAGTLSGAASVIRFLPDSLTIKAGDTVRWELRDPMELHTITFSGTDQPAEFITPRPQPQGPPKIYFNPKTVVRVGGLTQAGEGYYNSGFMAFDAPGPRTYSLTFTRPGTYTYWCVVHVPQGMRGVITVQ